MLKGVFFKRDEENISLVATDGRRLAVTRKLEKSSLENTGEFILPSLTVAELERLPSVANKIELNFTDRQVSLQLRISEKKDETNGFKGSIYLVSKVVEGKYPNFKQVIPKDDFNQAVIERELMLECVNRAALVSDEKVTLRIKNNEMEIYGQSTLGDASESMSIDYDGEDAVVSFNPKFILDKLKSIKKNKFNLEFRDDRSQDIQGKLRRKQ